jgi:hypothetical protein
MKKSIMFLVLLALALGANKALANGGGPPQITAPDGGSTALMLTAAVGGMTWCWKRLAR